jgi:hypothetical protein
MSKNGKYSYTEEDLQAAVASVNDGISLRKASEQWGIPQTTIHGRIRGGRSQKECKIRYQRLSPEQEIRLAGWAEVQREIGCEPTRLQLKAVAQRMLAADGITTPLGKRWVLAFIERNPSLKTLKDGRLSESRQKSKNWSPMFTPDGRKISAAVKKQGKESNGSLAGGKFTAEIENGNRSISGGEVINQQLQYTRNQEEMASRPSP